MMESLANTFSVFCLCGIFVLFAVHATEKRQTSSSDPLKDWMDRASRSKPNVLFLIVDDLRPQLGCYGDRSMVTPNIDWLARKSVMFKQAFVQVAVCNPSRASFLTGRRPDTTRVYDLKTYWRTAGGNFTTLPQYFKQHGYFVQGAGKIYHPGKAAGDNDGPFSWSSFYNGENPFSGKQRKEAAVRPVNNTMSAKLIDVDVADFSRQFLREYRDSAHSHQPFFLAVGFRKPHLPFLFPQGYLDLYPLSNVTLAEHRTEPANVPEIALSGSGEIRAYQDVAQVPTTQPGDIFPDDFQRKLRQGYSAATSYVDTQVGRVLRELSVLGFSDNTLVALLGDHGWHLGDNSEWCKHTNYDNALRVPMMLYIPGVTAKNGVFRFTNPLAPGFQHDPREPLKRRVTDELVEAVDLFPTLTELAGLPVPPTCPEHPYNVTTCAEGTSLVPLVRKVRKLPHDKGLQWKQHAFSQYKRRQYMGYSVRTKTHRYTQWYRFNQETFEVSEIVGRELYQHSTDPFEFSNLAEVPAHSGKVEEMAAILRQGWRKTLNDYLATLDN